MRLDLVTLVAIGLSLCASSAFAAKKKCAYEPMEDLTPAKNEKGKKRKGFYVDEFTNELIVATVWKDITASNKGAERSSGDMTGRVLISIGSLGDVAVPEAEHEKLLNLQIVHVVSQKTMPTDAQVQDVVSIPAESELLIAMADNSIVTLYSAGEVFGESTYDFPKAHSGEYFRLRSAATFVYKLDSADLAALAGNSARAVRIRTNRGDLDSRLTKKNWGAFADAVSCIQGGSK